MKAVVQERFGPPDVRQSVDTDLPEIGPDDVLIRVHAAAVNPYDWHVLRGDPCIARLIGGVGLIRPKRRVAGVDGAGRVEAVGTRVRGLAPGDEVLGWLDGAFAEDARTAADRVVPRPARLTFEQAAAVTMAGRPPCARSGAWAGRGPDSGCWSTAPRAASRCAGCCGR